MKSSLFLVVFGNEQEIIISAVSFIVAYNMARGALVFQLKAEGNTQAARDVQESPIIKIEELHRGTRFAIITLPSGDDENDD